MNSKGLLLLLTLFCPTVLIGEASRETDERLFRTKALADNREISESVEIIRTLGYHETGKGRATYIYSGDAVPQLEMRDGIKTNRPSSHYIAARSANKMRYYLLEEESPNVLQFGAVPDSQLRSVPAIDNTAAFNAALAYGRGVMVPPGRYYIAGTLFILQDGTTFYGSGPGGADQGGVELVFGPGTADCIQAGDGVHQLRWCKISRLAINGEKRAGGNAIFAFFNYQLTIDEMRILEPYNGIRLFRGIGFMVKNIVMSGIRAGEGTANGPTEIGYGLKFSGAPELYHHETGKRIKRDTHVLYVENLSFGSKKLETDPSNWTVGLWCAENAASVNGGTLKNQNVRHGIYITRAQEVDPKDPLLVPAAYQLVAPVWTDSAGGRGAPGRTYPYGSTQYPARPGTVVEENGRFQDLTLFYVGGDYLGGEYIYNEEGSGVAIFNPHFMRSYQGNCVYMGQNSRDMSVYGGQAIGAFKNGFEMHGQRWHISGVQVYRHSLDSANRSAHSGKYSAFSIGDTSVGGDIVNCKIGNEPLGTFGRAGSTVKFGVNIARGAKGTWIHGNRFEGCLGGDINNESGTELRLGTNLSGSRQ